MSESVNFKSKPWPKSVAKLRSKARLPRWVVAGAHRKNLLESLCAHFFSQSEKKFAAYRVYPTSYVGFVTLLAMGCSRGTVDKTAFHILVPKAIETVDPRHLRDAYALKLSRLIFASLVTIDPHTLELTPQLAERVDNITPTRYRVTLKSGLRFSDGSALDTQDVKATFQAVLDPKVRSRLRPYYEVIDRMDIKSATVIEFTLKRAHATFMGDLELPILRQEDAFLPHTLSQAQLIGAGPFRVLTQTNHQWRLQPVRDSARGLPQVLSIDAIVDENTRMLRMLSGRADIALNVFSPISLDRLKRDKNLSISRSQSASTNYLGFQTENRWLRHPEIRHAIAQGIDTQLIIQYKLGGFAQPAHGFIPFRHWAYVKRPPPFQFDPVMAKKRLDVFCQKHGLRPKDIRLTLKSSTDKLRLSIAYVIANMLNQLGLHVIVTPREFGTLMDDLAKGHFDMVTMQLPDLIEPNFLEYLFSSKNIPGIKSPDGSLSSGANRWRYRNVEVDLLLQRGLETGDTDQRRAIYAQLETIILRDLPVIPLWHEDHVAVVSTRARHFDVPRDGRWSTLIHIFR